MISAGKRCRGNEGRSEFMPVASPDYCPKRQTRVNLPMPFAWLLTLIDSDYAGRAYTAYGGTYVAASIAWLWFLEGARPDRWDIVGAAVVLVGAAIILFGPRLT